MPWPLAVIDIEASSLDLKGYPIEVGLALWPAPDDPVFGWSALIRPVEDWTRHGHWSPASAKVHGIRGTDLLAYGKPVEQVAMALNEILGVGVAWCDGAAYDTHWARALFKAAGVKPLFALGDWHRLAATLGKTARSRALDWLEVTKAQHRARNDAEQLLLALAHAVSAKTGPVQNLKLRLAGMNRTNASEQ